MSFGNHVLIFTVLFLGGKLEARRNEEDPHYYSKWGRGYQHGGYGYQHGSYGYHSQDQPNIFYGGTTPYRIFGKPPIAPRPHGYCKAVQLYMVFRHAERNPQPSPAFNEPPVDLLETVVNPLIERKTTGVSSSVDIKFPWKSPYLKKEYGLQVPEGDKQMYKIGRRFATRFPEILKDFSIADLNFTSSCYLRASQSATAFGLGYLQGKGHVTKQGFQPIPLTTAPCANDILHQQQRACPKWIKTVALNPENIKISEQFLRSERFMKTVRKVRTKLGLEGVKEIDEYVVGVMLLTCGWGVQTFGYSPDAKWCSLFNEEDQKVYDYYIDAYGYYRFGPGDQLNLDVGCPLLQDVLTNLLVMTGKITGKPKRKVIGRFGHASTIFAPIHKLGLFIDKVPLQADNYEQMRDREFRFGNIAPMSGNIAFVLYKCSYGEYKVQFYHNERLMKLPACHSKVSCTLDEFLSYYRPILDKCDFAKICKL